MLLMMAPMQILYEVSIWLVRIFGKKKAPEPEPI
jgi:Sec-independent protein secretion pathway component TatC